MARLPSFIRLLLVLDNIDTKLVLITHFLSSDLTLADVWPTARCRGNDHTGVGVGLSSIVPLARLTVVLLIFDPPRCYRVRAGDHFTLSPYSMVGNNRVGKDPFHLSGPFPSPSTKPWGRGGSVRSRCLASQVPSLKPTASMHLALSRSSVHASTQYHCYYCWLHKGQEERSMSILASHRKGCMKGIFVTVGRGEVDEEGCEEAR